MITVFADQYLFKIREIVPDAIDLQLYDPEHGLPADLGKADALLIRTVTGINKQTLSPVPEKLQFVATGSAGTDHVGTDFLAQHDITFAHSAGCNARSVAEYVVTSLLLWGESADVDLRQEMIGIIGVGHVGSALQQMLDELGWSYRLYDPPRAERETAFTSVTQEDVLDCSILTFHTPLHFNNEHATHHWLNPQKLANRNFKMVINTSRGGVVDEQALIQAKESGSVNSMIIDVWEGEPAFDDEVANKAFIATPHIAGYSIQAKFRATKMIIDQMINHFGLDLAVQSLDKTKEQIAFDTRDISNCSLSEVLTHIHPINKYYRELSKLIGQPEASKKRTFNRLRTSMPFRNEFGYLQLPDELFEQFPVLKQIGLEK